MNTSKRTYRKRLKEKTKEKQQSSERERLEKEILIEVEKQKEHDIQLEALKQQMILDEKIKQGLIEEFKFIFKFALALLGSITAILVIDEKSSILKYFTVLLTSISAVISIVFNTLLDTPKKMKLTKKSFRTKRFKILLTILVIVSFGLLVLVLLFDRTVTNIFIGLIFVCFTVFLLLIPLIINYFLK